MSGNLNEWTFDYFAKYPDEAQTDPTGPAEGDLRAVRGGSFVDESRHCRSAFRLMRPQEYRCRDVGIRVLRSLVQE